MNRFPYCDCARSRFWRGAGALLLLAAMTVLVSCGSDVKNPLAPSPSGVRGDGIPSSSASTLLQAGIPGTTKIAPSKGLPGKDFTIVDAPHGRLTEGAVAQFESLGRPTLFAPLRTHPPHMSAQGVLPLALVAGADYFVTVAAGGQMFDAGWFHVSGELALPPIITPTQGPVGTDFTIDDPMGRIQTGDVAVFYLPGDDPSTGTPATHITYSGSWVLNGRVPEVSRGLQYYVAVVSSTGEIRFAGVGFFVSA